MHAYHSHSIGLGIPLDDYSNPLAIALQINSEVLRANDMGMHERRIGNMATLSVYHPRVVDIIIAKMNTDLAETDWAFQLFN